MAMAKDTTKTSDRPKVFLSYSRQDEADVFRVRDALEVEGFAVLMDSGEIIAGEAWRKRLVALIREANKVVFLISESSVSSEVCHWEIDQTERLGRPVIPVLLKPTDITQIPGRLSRLHYEDLTQKGRDYSDAIARVIRALAMDIEWERTRTTLGEKADSWDKQAKRRSLLLQDTEEIMQAETWRDAKPRTAPDLPWLMLLFIRSSREHKTTKLWWLAIIGFVTTAAIFAAAMIAIFQRNLAIEREALATSRLLAAQIGDAEGPDRKFQLAADALEVAPTPIARNRAAALLAFWHELDGMAFVEGVEISATASELVDGSMIIGTRVGSVIQVPIVIGKVAALQIGDPEVLFNALEDGHVTAIKIGPRGRVYVGLASGRVVLIHGEEVSEVRAKITIDGDADIQWSREVRALALSPSGETVAVGDSYSSIEIITQASATSVKVFDEGWLSVTALHWLDETTLVYGTSAGELGLCSSGQTTAFTCNAVPDNAATQSVEIVDIAAKTTKSEPTGEVLESSIFALTLNSRLVSFPVEQGTVIASPELVTSASAQVTPSVGKISLSRNEILAGSPDGRLLVATFDGTNKLAPGQVHRDQVTGLVVGATDDLLYTVSEEGGISKWDLGLSTTEFSQQFVGYFDSIRAVEQELHGTILQDPPAIAKRNSEGLWRRVIELNERSLSVLSEEDFLPLPSVDSGFGEYLGNGTSGSELNINQATGRIAWDTPQNYLLASTLDGEMTSVLRKFDALIWSVTFSRDGLTLAALDQDGVLLVATDLFADEPTLSTTQISDSFRSIALSDDGSWIALGDENGILQIRQVSNLDHEADRVPMDSADIVRYIAFRPGQNDQLIVATTGIWLFDLTGASDPWEMKASDQTSMPQAQPEFSDDGRFVAFAVDGASVMVWDLNERALVASIPTGRADRPIVAFRGNSELLYSPSAIQNHLSVDLSVTELVLILRKKAGMRPGRTLFSD